MGVKIDQKLSKMAFEKNRRFVIFLVRFWRNLSLFGPIRIYRKTGPTKSTVLGPRPPPENSIKFIDFWPFLLFWGPSIEPEKASLKSASTPYPPWKVIFIGFFNNLLPNFVPIPFYLITTQFRNCITLNFLVLGIVLLWEKPNSFSFFWLLVCFSFVCCLCSGRNQQP
jgi:hypothetical protein